MEQQAPIMPLDSSLGTSSHDLNNLLTSNDVPLDSDIPFIRDIISEEQARLDALDAQIHNSQAILTQIAHWHSVALDRHRGGAFKADTQEATFSQISALQDAADFAQARAEIIERVRQYRAILSPVRRVPPELICEIFILTLLSGDEEDPMNSPRAPWRLGLVCRSWRHAALSYIPLWCHITIPSSRTDTAYPPAGMMETQLARSANAPLHVFWRGDETIDPLSMALVRARSSRWRALRLDFRILMRGPSVDLLSWLNFATGSFPQLQKLDVVTADSLLKIPSAFLVAPALREVILTDRKFTFNSPGSINIPWAQITHYRGKFHRERQLEILRDAPALLECAMCLSYDYFIGQDGSFPMVTMPRLRRLCVKGTRILDFLETPVLQSLFSLQNPRLDNMLSFIRRSACPLTKLVLMQCRISSELITLLQILPPTLTHLVIGCHFDAPRMPSTLLNLMTISAAVPDLCPNLTSFWYGYEPAEDEEDSNFPRDPFFAMVQSRLQPTCPFRLACLRVFHTHESLFAPSDDVVTRMETLRDGGLDAVFLSHQAFETQKDFV